MKPIRGLAIAGMLAFGGPAWAGNNISHTAYASNDTTFSSADFGSLSVLKRLIASAGHQWVATAGNTVSFDISGTTNDTSCGIGNPNFIFGVNGCVDPPACQQLGNTFGCPFGGVSIELDQLANGTYSSQPANTSNSRIYFMMAAMHEFGHALGLDDIPFSSGQDQCTMNASVGPADSYARTHACVHDNQALKSIDGNTFQSSGTFVLAASSTGNFPVVGSSGFSIFTDAPGWNYGFADFARPLSLSGNSNANWEVEGGASFNWLSWNGGNDQASFFTSDSQVTRPSVVVAGGMLWAFWVEDVGANDYRVKYATSTDNFGWTQRGFVTDNNGNFARTRSQVSVSYDPVSNKVFLAYTVWDNNFLETGGSCPSTGCTTELTMFSISGSNPGGSWSAPARLFQTGVGAPAIYCATSPTETTFVQCQVIWTGTDANRTLVANFVKFFNSGGYSSSGASFVGSQTDFPPAVDGDVSMSGNYGIVFGHTGLDGRLKLATKNCSADCGTMSSWFVPSGVPNPIQLGPVIRTDPGSHFYRIFLPN